MGDSPISVSFFGTRGSTPCAGDGTERFGGQTSCVIVDNGDAPIILDLGTGLRRYGCDLKERGVRGFKANVLLTHTHWDHVQGLPFFAPLLDPTTELDVFGPGDCGKPFEALIPEFMSPPFFPVTPDQLPAQIRFHNLAEESRTIGGVEVTARPVAHTGASNGYRLDFGDVSMAFVPDHQEPIGRPTFVADSVLELCDEVDLLIHDGQYTPELLAVRPNWGHCTIDYAVEVARQSNAKSLALFHHDPGHDDETIETLVAEAVAKAGDLAHVEIYAAATGQTVKLGAQ